MYVSRGGNVIKKGIKILLIVLLVILAVLGFTAYHFRSYISAYMLSRNNTTEDLEQLRKDAQSAEKVLENYDNINVRDLTDEEQKKLADNELSEEEAIDLILGMLGSDTPSESIDDVPQTPPTTDDTTTADVPPQDTPATTPSVDEKKDPITFPDTPQDDTAQNNVPQNDATQNEQPTQDETMPTQNDALKEVNEQVARLVAKLYVVKAQANNEINTLDNDLKAQYVAECKALSPEERKTQKMTIKAKYLKQAAKVLATWEKTYDTNVESIISEVETLLKDSGQDTALAQTLRTAYNDEKTYIKAYYLNRVSDDD